MARYTESSVEYCPDCGEKFVAGCMQGIVGMLEDHDC